MIFISRSVGRFFSSASVWQPILVRLSSESWEMLITSIRFVFRMHKGRIRGLVRIGELVIIRVLPKGTTISIKVWRQFSIGRNRFCLPGLEFFGRLSFDHRWCRFLVVGHGCVIFDTRNAIFRRENPIIQPIMCLPWYNSGWMLVKNHSTLDIAFL